MNKSDCLKGTVIDRNNDMIVIAVNPDSSKCEGCAAFMLCQTRQTVEITVPDKCNRYDIGTEISVRPERNSIMNAAMLFFICPLAIFVITLLSMTGIGVKQIFSALVSFGTTALYFAILFLTRQRFNTVKWIITDM